MKLLKDYQGLAIRLTDERLAHILEHPEMRGLEAAVELALWEPEMVVQSAADLQVRLYYRFCPGTSVGDKYLCVVVKMRDGDAFVIATYLTDRPKKGAVLWPRRS